MDESSPVGRTGLVTTTIPADGIGEVRVAIAGGTTTYGAYGVDRSVRLPTGTRVSVVELFPPRTVVVAPTAPAAPAPTGPQDTPGWSAGL